MNTPILKATKLNKVIQFYNQGDYEKWKESNENGKGFKIKYYKGLGTVLLKNLKNILKRRKLYTFQHQQEDDKLIDKVFNKAKSNERKTWLTTYDRERYLDVKTQYISYENFLDDELIHFSKYDCDRSIPKLMDGLKISQRKIV